MTCSVTKKKFDSNGDGGTNQQSQWGVAAQHAGGQPCNDAGGPHANEVVATRSMANYNYCTVHCKILVILVLLALLLPVDYR